MQDAEDASKESPHSLCISLFLLAPFSNQLQRHRLYLAIAASVLGFLVAIEPSLEIASRLSIDESVCGHHLFDISGIIFYEPKSTNAFNVSGRLRVETFFRVRSLTMAQRQVAMTAKEQIAYLRDEKDVSFKLVNEDEACAFLSNWNYFFKIKAFAKNYDKRMVEGNAKGKYINLDFGHLVELSRLDKYLRDLVLMLTLDIEHNLKVRINRAAMRQGVDPYDLTVRYLAISGANVVADQKQKFDDETARRCLCEIKQNLEETRASSAHRSRSATRRKWFGAACTCQSSERRCAAFEHH